MTETERTQSGCIEFERIAPDDTWVTTAEAARILNSSVSAFTSYRLRSSIRNCSRSVRGASAYRNGRLWHRGDVELAARIRREARTGIAVAARVACALREARIPAEPADSDTKQAEP